MKIPLIKFKSDDSEAAGRPTSSGARGHVVLLLMGARLFFLVIGLVFLLGETLDILIGGDDLTSRIIVRIAVLSIMAPAIVWVSTKWAEKILYQAFESQKHLIQIGISRAAQDIQAVSTAVSDTDGITSPHRNEDAVLAQMGRIVTSSLDINDIYMQFTQQVRNVLGFDLLVICTVDDARRKLTREFTSGDEGTSLSLRGHILPVEGTMSKEAIERKATLVTQGIGSNDLMLSFPGMTQLIEDGMMSFLTSPLLSSDRVIGIMGLASRTPMAFSERDREFVESATLQIGGALANSQLHALLQREAHDKELLAEIGRVVSSSPHLDDVFEHVSDLIREMIPADRVSVTLTSGDGEMFRIAFVSGYDIPGRMVGQLLPMPGSLTEKIVKQRRGEIFQNSTEEDIAAEIPGVLTSYSTGLHSIMGVPLFSNDVVIGCLQLRTATEDAYNSGLVALTERIADQIAGAMANSELNHTLEMEIAEKTALVEIGKTMSMSLDMEEVYDRFGEIVRNLAPSDRFAVNLVTPDGDELEIAYYSGDYMPDRGIGSKISLEGSVGGQVVRTKSTLVLDMSSPSEISQVLSQLKPSSTAGFQSILATPLIVDDEVVGVMQFRSRAANAYGESVVRVVENVASHVAGFISNARLHAKVQSEAKERTILAEIGRLMSSSPEIHNIYQHFADLVKDIIPSDRLSVGILDRSGNATRLAYVTGVEIPSVAENSLIGLAGSLNNRVMTARKGLIVQDKSLEETENEYPSMVPGYRGGLRSAIGVPLIANDQVIGCLQFRSFSESAYTARHLELAERVSDQISGALANAESRKTLQHEFAERSALAEIGRVVSSSPDIHDVYKRFGDLVKGIIPFHRISIGLLAPGGKASKLAYVTGAEIPQRVESSMIQVERSLNEKIMKTRKGLIVQGMSEDELAAQFPSMAEGYRTGLLSAMGVPLIANDEVIGFMRFRSSVESAYTAHHLELAERVSDQISGAIANSEMRSTLEQVAAEKTVLAEIGKTITLSLDIEDVYERFTELVKPLAAADRITISLLTDDGEAVYVAYTSGDPIQGRNQGDRISIDGTIAGEAILNRKTVVLHPQSVADLEGHLDRLMPSFKAGFRSFIAAPLVVQNKAIGALQIRSRSENAYTEATALMAESISAQVASAIANSRLHASMQRESERRAVLAEIGRVISSSLDLDTVYDEFADAVKKLIPFDRISINMIDKSNGVFSDAFVRGKDVPNRRPGDITEIDGSITEAVIADRGPKLLQPEDDSIDDLKTSYPRLAPSLDKGIKSFLSVPLIAQDSVVGVLHFSSVKAAAFTPDHVSLAENVAAQIAGAISSARLHAEVKESQEALSQSEWRYRHMVESASDIVCTLDDQGYITYANHPITKVTEFTEDELIGRHFTEIVSPDWKNRVLKTCIINPREFGEECVMEFPIETKSGETRWLEQTIAPMLNEGKIVGFQGIARDITARREIESEREALITELQEALAKIKTLSGLLPICASCKKVRDDNGYWSQIETYISAHSEADFSHSICPTCVTELYPQLKAASPNDM